ncbi:MAG: Rieske (2Fe-2S) protein [Phenylobacterium sp.]
MAEIADPGAKGFRFRAETRLFAAFLVRRGDDVSGWIDQCPHAGWPLGAFDDRYLTRDGAHILCTGHGGLFDLSGRGVTTPCVGQHLTPWPVAVRAGEVFTA